MEEVPPKSCGGGVGRGSILVIDGRRPEGSRWLSRTP